MTTPELSVIIVSYNTRELLLSCLRSLRRVGEEARFEVIVVDNASQDGSAEAAQSEFPEVTVIQSPRNAGFAAGMNLGVERAGGEFLFLLNPDTVVPKGAIPALLAFLWQHPQAAAAGAGVTYPDGSPQPSTFGFSTLGREFLNFLPELKAVIQPRRWSDLSKRLLNGKVYRVGELDPPFLTECVSGAAFMARTAAIRDMGGFDSGFFLYHEEMDLCRRLRDAGWEVWSVPAAQVIHWDAQATGYRTSRLPHSPLLEWRIGGMDRLWYKHKPPREHRRWRAQARALLRLRIAANQLALPFVDRKARIQELKRVVTMLSDPPPSS